MLRSDVKYRFVMDLSSDVNTSRYSAVFFAGGHGTVRAEVRERHVAETDNRH
jgi:hypothetical protein